MREKMKRLTAALCAVVLAAALLPGAVWAEELTAAPAEEPSQAPAEVQAVEEEMTAAEAVEEEPEDAVPETAVWLRSDPTTHELVEVDLPADAATSWEDILGQNIATLNEDGLGEDDEWIERYFDLVTVPRYGFEMIKDNSDARYIYNIIMALATINASSNAWFIPYSIDSDVNCSPDNAALAMHAFIADYPEMFWSEPMCGINDAGDRCTAVAIVYNKHQENVFTERDAFLTAVDGILAGMPDGSDYEKELYLHDTLIKNVIYDMDYAEEQNAYSALVNGRAVCAGYASAFEYLLMRAGIESYYVVGKSHGEGHAWNLAKIGGQWYYVDLTWDDPQMKDENQNLIESPYSPHYAYFNITTEMLTRDHDLSGQPENVPLPECNSINAFYHSVNHSIVTTQEGLMDRVVATLRYNQGKARLYADGFDAAKILNWYIEDNNFAAICKALGATGNISFGGGVTGNECVLIFKGSFVPPPVGELNGIGDVDITDMQLLYQYLTTDTVPHDQTTLSLDAFLQNANVNGDDDVDVYDLQALYEIVNKIR